MGVHRLDRAQAQRIAVRAQLLSSPRPTDLLAVVGQLTLLQIDPTAAVAPSADLIAWSRLGSSYQPAQLQQALEQDRTLLEHNVAWPSTGWTNNRNVSQTLEFLAMRGEVAIAGRRGRQRLWDLAERVYPADTPASDWHNLKVARILKVAAALLARHPTWNRLWTVSGPRRRFRRLLRGVTEVTQVRRGAWEWRSSVPRCRWTDSSLTSPTWWDRCSTGTATGRSR